MSRMSSPLFHFTARVVRGAGRGRTIGSPTLNLDLQAVPDTLKPGIYACFASWGRTRTMAAMHFGPRPVFHDSLACEVHVIGKKILRAPQEITVEVAERLRDIRNFPSIEALQEQISLDIAQARAILKLP